MEATEKFQSINPYDPDVIFAINPYIGSIVEGLIKGYEQPTMGWLCGYPITDSNVDDTSLPLKIQQIKLRPETKVNRLEIYPHGLLMSIVEHQDDVNADVNSLDGKDIFFDTSRPLAILDGSHIQSFGEQALIGKIQSSKTYEKSPPKELEKHCRILKYHEPGTDENDHSQLGKDFLEKGAITLRVDVINSLGELQEVCLDIEVVRIITSTGARITAVDGNFKDSSGELRPGRIIFANGSPTQLHY